MVRQNLTAGKSKRVAAYVDELKTLKGRRKEAGRNTSVHR